ncbi:MAG: hypothetical protein KGN77_02040 [Xanthomonadaceae bacterium]|nr:hypothetical protein [Xanthomonadaceae bacterium]
MNANALKTHFKLDIGDAGGLDAAASIPDVRVARSQLAAYGDINQPDRLAPVDVVLAVERITGNPRVVAHMAAELGYRLQRVELPDTGELSQALAELARDEGALFAELVPYVNRDMVIPEKQRAGAMTLLRRLVIAAQAIETILAPKVL